MSTTTIERTAAEALGLHPGTRVEESLHWSVDEVGEAATTEGFEFIDDVEWSYESWSFDLTRAWAHRPSGKVFVASDSGCSCPSPFEYTTIGDLVLVESLADLDRVTGGRRSGTPNPVVVDDYVAFRKRVEQALADEGVTG